MHLRLAASTSGAALDRADADIRCWQSAPDPDLPALYLDARLKYWLQQGFQCRYAFPAAHEHSELVALLERGSQALGEAAAGHTASHYLMGAGVESIDGQQQAGQTRRGHA